ncbi:MAG: sensor histidine kinase [Chitinophagaceae bacterium]|nr:sensor histidine kinase [Chitinophagaceae bacterium]
MSGARAYINGESEYSKAQKDAVLYLYNYLEAGDEVYWTQFKREIAIPVSDNDARKAIISHQPDSIIYRGFVGGRNAAADSPDMVWLFRNFSKVSFMKEAIATWQNAEPAINEINFLGNEIHEKQDRGTLSLSAKKTYTDRLTIISKELSAKERVFSSLLSAGARKVNFYLFITNIFFILIITGSLVLAAREMLMRLFYSEHHLLQANETLIASNKELDVFISSVSHDLRSPVASLKGLLKVILKENDPQLKDSYLYMMQDVLEKQDRFLVDMLNFLRDKRTVISRELLSLRTIIEDIVSASKFTAEQKGIEIKLELDLDEIRSDKLRLQMILNNLISNAIRYSDSSKKRKYISIKTFKQNNQCLIEIEDNGVGIDSNYQAEIFNIFQTGLQPEKGTGLGLFIVKNSAEKLNGYVKVESEPEKGSKFIVGFNDC